MGALLCRRCCPCKIVHNSIGDLPEQSLKILIIGPTGSGKTEVAHLLSKTKRIDFEPTNGSKFYTAEVSIGKRSKKTIGLTEIGGSEEMQQIWHHYLVSTMGIIYCFDMSAYYEDLDATFQLLHQVMAHSFVRGKPILLIGTKSDLTHDGLQMYDFENEFHLVTMAKIYGCSLRTTYSGDEDISDLTRNMAWFVKSIKDNYEALQLRIQHDKKLKNWVEQTEKLIAAGKLRPWSYHRFPTRGGSKRRKQKMFWKYGSPRVMKLQGRPNTAPAVLTFAKSSQDNATSCYNSNNTVDTINTVETVQTVDTVVTELNELENTESKEDLFTASTSQQVQAVIHI